MGILRANLRHLYQYRAIWWFYAFFGLTVCPMIAWSLHGTATGWGKFALLVIYALAAGLGLAQLHVGILTKPFSYCLPGHREMPRQFVFLTGISVNILWSAVFLLYTDLSLQSSPAVFFSVFFAGLLSYLVGAVSAFIPGNAGAAIGFLPFAIIFGSAFFNLHIILERVIVGSPYVVIVSGVLGSALAWIWLGNRGLARRLCGVPRLGLFAALNRSKLQKYSRANYRQPKQHLLPYVEELFVGRITGCEYAGTARYVWGALYTSFAVLLSRWQGLFFLLVFALVFASYTSRVWFMFPLLMMVFAISSQPPAYSSMLTAGGRKERFLSSVAVAVAATMMAVTFIAGIALLSMPLSSILPQFTLRGMPFVFRPIDFEFVLWALLIIPIVYTVQVVFYRKPYLLILTVILAMPILTVILTTYSTMAIVPVWKEHLALLANPVSVISSLVLCWLTAVVVLHHICMKKCLVN